MDNEDGGEDPYTVIKNADRENGGMMDMKGKVPEEVPPHWNPYFNVEDISRTIEAAKEHGGEILAGPMELPVGTFAIIQDPDGASFTAMQCKYVDD